MSSQVIVTKSALSEEDNYLGYTDLGDQNVDGISDPILLTRVAARIDLVNISTRLPERRSPDVRCESMR